MADERSYERHKSKNVVGSWSLLVVLLFSSVAFSVMLEAFSKFLTIVYTLVELLNKVLVFLAFLEISHHVLSCVPAFV